MVHQTAENKIPERDLQFCTHHALLLSSGIVPHSGCWEDHSPPGQWEEVGTLFHGTEPGSPEERIRISQAAEIRTSIKKKVF
ncbi:hypothetical protein DPEC_G00050170 [Dallia pectoralis]|uniref:Uncharacterized protein n=1 Tax=Dallia pectoralis TaxID=75939 RepID=A0ACC2HBL3_DALPE|nr:hypothetical protein DPEC_G00050170 [Dallia pectoralis]